MKATKRVANCWVGMLAITCGKLDVVQDVRRGKKVEEKGLEKRWVYVMMKPCQYKDVADG